MFGSGYTTTPYYVTRVELLILFVLTGGEPEGSSRAPTFTDQDRQGSQ